MLLTILTLHWEAQGVTEGAQLITLGQQPQTLTLAGTHIFNVVCLINPDCLPDTNSTSCIEPKLIVCNLAGVFWKGSVFLPIAAIVC